MSSNEDFPRTSWTRLRRLAALDETDGVAADAELQEEQRALWQDLMRDYERAIRRIVERAVAAYPALRRSRPDDFVDGFWTWFRVRGSLRAALEPYDRPRFRKFVRNALSYWLLESERAECRSCGEQRDLESACHAVAEAPDELLVREEQRALAADVWAAVRNRVVRDAQDEDTLACLRLRVAADSDRKPTFAELAASRAVSADSLRKRVERLSNALRDAASEMIDDLAGNGADRQQESEALWAYVLEEASVDMRHRPD